jgi:hypothetical protein
MILRQVATNWSRGPVATAARSSPPPGAYVLAGEVHAAGGNHDRAVHL